MPRGNVRDHLGDEERAVTRRAVAFGKLGDFLFKGLQAADAGQRVLVLSADTAELNGIKVGDTVDIRFGMYEATAGLTRRHEDVALDFAAEGFKKLVLTRETTDNNNYANMFMTRSYVDLALCRGGFGDVAVEQIKQVGRTPEYNTTVLNILREHLQRLNPGTDPVAILYTTYGNPWPGSSPVVSS